MTEAPSGLSTAAAAASTPPAVRFALAPLLLAALTCSWSPLKIVGGPLTVSDFMLVLSLLVTLPTVLINRLPLAVPPWMFIPGLVIPACVLAREIDPPSSSERVMSLHVNQYFYESFTKAMIWLAGLYVVPLAIIAATLIERRAVEWTMAAYIVGVAVSSLVAVTDLIGITHVAENLPYVGRTFGYIWGSGRFPGLSDHPNSLGFTILISLPFVIYFMSRTDRKWIPGIALMLLTGGLLASGSRSAQALAPVCLLAAVLWLPNKRGTVRATSFSLAATLGIATVLLYTALADKKSELLRFFGSGAEVARRGGDSERLALIKVAWNEWKAYPIFGGGLRQITEAHNILLQLLASGGVVLAAGMVIYFIWILRDCWSLVTHGEVFARFLTISISAWMAFGFVGNQLTGREMYFTVGCVAALIVTINLHGPWADRSADRLPMKSLH